jgi:aspartyl/asparaginyl beta-hydroxylase (cupin superfamily)
MNNIDKNPKLFYNITEFEELRVLEDNYDIIKNELLQLLQSQINGWNPSYPNYLTSDSKGLWKTFTFQFFNIKNIVNIKKCPKTFDVLSKIPELITAEFSHLPPNTHIKPHKGFTRMVLRVHLGLIVPKECAIRVENQTRPWEEGKVLILDDSFEHEAWNKSDDDRFILMLDIANPSWGYSANEISKYKIENMEDVDMLSIFSKDQWLKFYEKGYFI